LSKITNGGLNGSDTGCFIAYPYGKLATVGVKGLTIHDTMICDMMKCEPSHWINITVSVKSRDARWSSKTMPEVST